MFKLVKENPVFVEPAKIEPKLGIKEGEDIYTMTEYFFIRHRQLRESADRVVFIHTPRCRGKSWTEKLIQSAVKPKYSHVYGSYIVDEWFRRNPRTKLLKSKSKQSRIVSVVCK